MRGLEQGFLNASSSSRMRFGVMWANQDWVDIMPAKRLSPSPPKFSGATNATVFAELSQYWIDRYFALPNYLTAPVSPTERACPLVSIYEINELVESLGGIPEAGAAFADFRARAAAAGHACVHVQVMGFGARALPAPFGASLQAIGVNSVTDYCPQCVGRDAGARARAKERAP